MSGLGSFIQGAFQGYSFGENIKDTKAERKRREADDNWLAENRDRQRQEWNRTDEERRVHQEAWDAAQADYDAAQSNPAMRNNLDDVGSEQPSQTNAGRGIRPVVSTREAPQDLGDVGTGMVGARPQVSQLADVTLDDLQSMQGYGPGQVDPRLARSVNVPQERSVRPAFGNTPAMPQMSGMDAPPSVGGNPTPPIQQGETLQDINAEFQAVQQEQAEVSTMREEAKAIAADIDQRLSALEQSMPGPVERSVRQAPQTPKVNPMYPELVYGGPDRSQATAEAMMREQAANRGNVMAPVAEQAEAPAPIAMNAMENASAYSVGPQQRNGRLTARGVRPEESTVAQRPPNDDAAQKAETVRRLGRSLLDKLPNPIEDIKRSSNVIWNGNMSVANEGLGYGASFVGATDTGAEAFRRAEGQRAEATPAPQLGPLARNGRRGPLPERSIATAGSGDTPVTAQTAEGATTPQSSQQSDQVSRGDTSPLDLVAVTPASGSESKADVTSTATSNDRVVTQSRGVNGSTLSSDAMKRAEMTVIDHYYNGRAQEVLGHYMRTGQIDKAEAMQQLIDAKEYQGLREVFSKVAVSAMLGDVEGMLDSATKLHAQIDDGLEVVRDQSGIVNNSDGTTGVSVTFKDTKTGKTFTTNFSSIDDFTERTLPMVMPDGIIEYTSSLQAAANAANADQMDFERDLAKDVYLETLKRGYDQQEAEADLRTKAVEMLQADITSGFNNLPPEEQEAKVQQMMSLLKGGTNSLGSVNAKVPDYQPIG